MKPACALKLRFRTQTAASTDRNDIYDTVGGASSKLSHFAFKLSVRLESSVYQ